MGQASARYSEQGHYGKLKTLVVKRSVYTAAQELLSNAEAKGGPAPSRAATEKVAESFAAGSLAAARFWSEVHLFVVSYDFLDGQLNIIEEPAAKL